MLLDEPTASLDLGYQLEIASLLRRLNRELGIAMVVATHDLNFAASVCEHLVLLRDGEVIASGPVGEVLTRERVLDLYRVEADVAYHEARRPRDGHSAAARWRRAPDRGRGRDRAAAPHRLPAVFGALAFAAVVLAPLARRHADPARTASSTGRFRSPTTPTRRSSSWRGCRARSPARWSAPRSPRPASCCRRCSATRSPRRSRWASRPALRSARCWRLPSRSPWRCSGSPRCPWPAWPAPSVRRRSCTRLATASPPRPVDQRPAARRRDAQRVLLGGDPLRPVPGGLQRRPSGPCGG